MGIIENIVSLSYLAIPIILLIMGIVGIWLMVSTRYKNVGRILVMPLILGSLFLAVSILGAIVVLISSYADVLVPMIFILGVLLAALIACALWGVLKKKAVYIPILICTAVCLAVCGSVIAYQSFDSNIPTLGENNDILYDYVPYAKDTKVAELDEPSTLTIDSDMPRMDGATALYPIYSAFAKAVYPEESVSANNVYSYYLTCNTTTGAYETIVTGESDIIFVAAPSEEQKQYAAENGVELIYTPIGKEAFVFFVNSNNPIDDLTLEQVQAIYSGEITSWSELGVNGLGDIRAFQRDEGSGSQTTLERIMAGKELMTPPMEDVVSGMGGIIERAADYKNYKNAIGYSFRFYSTEMVANDQIKLLSINGVAPTTENIENGTYPLASYFYAVTRSDAGESTNALVEWILSDQGQELIEKTGYSPLDDGDVISGAVDTTDILPEEEQLSDAEIEEINALRPDYGLGTCRNLSGDITVALYFVNDFESKWSDEEAMNFIEFEALPGLAFLEQQAAEYGVELKFEVEVFSNVYYDDDVIVDMKGTGYATVNVLEHVAEDLGYRTDYGLHDDLLELHGHNEAICLTIFNKNGSSYALNPKADYSIDIVEHAIIFAHDLNSDGTEPIGSQASLVASNIIYLYGGESLNSPESRKKLTYFAYGSDIMRSASYCIEENTISDITAFYIGWIDEVPPLMKRDGWNQE